MALDTTIGWSTGDDLRVLLAGGISIGVYQVGQIQSDMNYLGTKINGFVANVTTLLDDYDTIQTTLSELNQESEGKVLTKADVLEWTVKDPSTMYGPEKELLRISELLAQYFASSPLFSNQSMHNGITTLYRS
jgi:hypothetical protein